MSREDQDFREKRLAETLARALVEAIRGMLENAAEPGGGDVTSLAAPSAEASATSSLDPASSVASSPPPQLTAPESGLDTKILTHVMPYPHTTPAESPFASLSPPSIAAQLGGSPVPGGYQPEPPLQVSLGVELPVTPIPTKSDYGPTNPPKWELEPLVNEDTWNHVSAEDRGGQQRHVLDLDQRTRAYDASVSVLADQNLEYDQRFRDYRQTEYVMLNRVTKDLAEDYRRLESLTRAFCTCRSTITDANV